MSSLLIYILFVVLPFVLIATIYLFWQERKSRIAKRKLHQAEADGMTEPASLHPVIDPSKCLGCATCVYACPEGEILGLVKRKAALVSPSSCIGHGACKDACPMGAISLVFGTATRGIEIPRLNSDFETNVPGIFISGELGGMGLIKNAIAQGQQAVNAIAKKRKSYSSLPLDLVIVGAGPAGLSAALAAKEEKLRYVILEQEDTIGGTIAHYPRGKVVMTRPAVLPVVGKFQFREASKETLIEFWQSVVKNSKLKIMTKQRVEHIEGNDKGIKVKTANEEFVTGSVLLAMGRRGTPRKLGVPGEDLPKVVYRLTDPEQYMNRHVLVVGGGDSALEAALAIAEQDGTTTTLSYRSEAFSRAKAKNRDRVSQLQQQGRLNVLLKSSIIGIAPDSVAIETEKGPRKIKNESIIVCAGGVLPTPFLKKIGIHVEEKFGTL